MGENNKPLVSVIIPTYKRPNMLGRAIKSVMNQTYDRKEIIVVDDNDSSSSYRIETAKFMEEYNEYSNVKYVKHNKNKGGSEARNSGINIASGKYVSFLDDDDEYFATKVEKQVKEFSDTKKENLGFVYCQMDIYDRNNRLIKKTQNYYQGNKEPFEANIQSTIAGTPSIMAKRSALIKVGGFQDLKSGQDWKLIMDILDAGYEVDYLEESLVKVYIHDEERISTNMQKIIGHNDLFVIKKKYFDRINEKLKRKIISDHFLYLAHFYNEFSKKNSFKYFYKGFKNKKISKGNIVCLLSILEPMFIKKIRKK